MGYQGVVVSALALLATVAASPSLRDNSLDVGERVVLVAPVLAPPRDSRTHSADRARQFPILVLLAQANLPDYERLEPEERSLKGNPEPIYVKVIMLLFMNCKHFQLQFHFYKNKIITAYTISVINYIMPPLLLTAIGNI